MQTVSQNHPSAPTAPKSARTEKYLSFQVGAEEFAISVLSVREIMGIQDITSVPQTPGYVKGIINLRGKVVPVIDLRLKFGMQSQEYTPRTCIIVVSVAGATAPLLMGIVVDSVSEVLNVGAADIESTPDFGQGAHIPYLLGIAKNKGKVKILLDIEKVIHATELTGLGQLN